MIDRQTFFERVRSRPFGGSLAQGAVDGMNAILKGWEATGFTNLSWLAYAFATAFHETGPLGGKGHMLPRTERGGPTYFTKYDDRKDLGNVKAGDGYRYRGRGLVQLTGRANYVKAGAKLGIPLVDEPDRALETAVAVPILFNGMADGWFTGKKFSDFLTDAKSDFIEARRIINGTDKASMIAGYANDFLSALIFARQAVTVPPMAGAEPAPAPGLPPVILPSTPQQQMPDDPGSDTGIPASTGHGWGFGRWLLVLSVLGGIAAVIFWLARA